MSFRDVWAKFRAGLSLASYRAACVSNRARKPHSASSSYSASSTIEKLEERVVLYAASGNAWPSSQVVTISFEPDGANLGGVTNNINSAFDGNAQLNGQWKNEILRAAQAWAQVTNLNFVVVEDNGAATGSGSYQQGDPNFGDIRIAGYNFGTSTLASAIMPPPVNNYSIAGDIVFNTGVAFGIGSNYDLYTVALHEIGHSLGLDHSSASSTSVMWPVYNGVKAGLASDDISGIRSIYSGGNARSADSYETNSGNNNINDAKNIAGDLVRSQKSGVINGLDITTTSDVDFYRLAMPAWTGSTLVVKVQSSGFSQLAPKLTIYDKDKTTVLGTVSGAGQHGTSISLTINGVVGSDVFYLKVEGAESNSFGVGAYGITLDLGASTPPVLTPPNTTLANGNPLQSGGGQALTEADDGYGPGETGTAPAAPAIDNIPIFGKGRSISGTGAVGTTIVLFIDGLEAGSSTVDSDGFWSIKLGRNLSEGVHTLTAIASDLSGNLSALSTVKTISISARGAAKR